MIENWPKGGHYRVIVADPPWQYAVWSGDKGMRTAESFYATMSAADLKALPVISLAHPQGCALFLWSTGPCIPEAITLMASWGFQYKTVAFVWEKRTKNDKQAFGMCHYTRPAYEYVLLGTRGKIAVQDHGVRQSLSAGLREHSRKPDELYALVERLVPGPYLELFARQSWPSWDRWGLEAPV